MFKHYSESYVSKNLWRIRRTHDFNDAMQEAWLMFAYCARRYARVVDNPAWFMAIYKQSLAQRIVDLGWKDSKQREASMLMCEVLQDDQADLDMVGEVSNTGELLVKLRQAPVEIRNVLAVLLNAPLEILETLGVNFPHMRRQGHMAQACRALHRELGPQQADALLDEVRGHLE